MILLTTFNSKVSILGSNGHRWASACSVNNNQKRASNMLTKKQQYLTGIIRKMSIIKTKNNSYLLNGETI
jgi:hypothetical protein